MKGSTNFSARRRYHGTPARLVSEFEPKRVNRLPSDMTTHEWTPPEIRAVSAEHIHDNENYNRLLSIPLAGPAITDPSMRNPGFVERITHTEASGGLSPGLLWRLRKLSLQSSR
jgi:hypothetical protein